MSNKLIDKKELFNILEKEIKNLIGIRINRSNSVTQDVGGGVFTSYMQDGRVVAAYFHPDKKHSATADGGLFGGGMVRSIKGPGEWAIASTSAGIARAKTYWNNDVE